jgi:PDZ domain
MDSKRTDASGQPPPPSTPPPFEGKEESKEEAKEEAKQDDDITSKAAVALAAVAAAATANHKSPVAAAKEAKDMAQNFIQTSTNEPNSAVTNRNTSPSARKTVNLNAVKTHLRQRSLEISSNLTDRLANAQNDSFLEFLLIIEYYEINENGTADASLAAQRVESLLKRIEAAYDALLDMLPPSNSPEVIPDLLPPCTQPGGDVTLAFFKACLGDSGSAPTAMTASSGTLVPATSSLQPHDTSARQAASSSTVFNMFKKIRKKSIEAPFPVPVPPASLKAGEYCVQIDREMLGLTVENVLERTVVRTVVPGGPAKKAGAKVGSLIVAVNNQETVHLTHFETIDELRQSNRPLTLVLRQVSEDALRSAREEMGRLIQGAGFGDSASFNAATINRRFNSPTANQKQEAIKAVGNKLIWILTLLVAGLEDQGDAARSVSKVLLDYTKNNNKLSQVGDVLQRTRTFLADPYLSSAALLRGELIACLCDVLDLDTEMELAEEQEGNDLGSAGSLLKLIVLNCPVMKSPCCDSIDEDIDTEEAELRYGKDTAITDRHSLHAGNRFLAVVHRLAASRSTAARIAACSLGPVLWSHLDFPHQLQLRGVITRALHDVEVLVRKATAKVLHEIAELVFDKRSVPWLVLMCERAMTDPEPQLRSAAMTLTWHLAEHLPNAFFGDARQGSRYLCRLPDREDPLFPDVYLLQCKLLPVATRLAEDRSPSVRLAVAAQSDRLCDALGAHWSSVIIDVLLGLLSDADERVRCEAVSCVPRLSEIVLLSTKPGEKAASEVSILEALLPTAIKLHKDTSVAVRVALATATGELLTLLVALQNRHNHVGDYTVHVDDRLIPMVQKLLNDPDPEVTSASLRAVTNATRQRSRNMSVASADDDASISSAAEPVVVPVLSEEQVLRLLPTLTELSDSKKWRVRQSAVEIVPALLGCTSESTTRTEISKLCVKLLGDTVDAVRSTAAECLCLGIRDSSSWMDLVAPMIDACATHTNSKQRLLSLKMIPTAIAQGAPSALVNIVLPLVDDPIANIRLNVGRQLETVLSLLDDADILSIIEALQRQQEAELSNRNDADVLYFSGKCLRKAESLRMQRKPSLG